MKFQQATYNIGYPAYGARFLNDNVLLVAGGGGEGNNGIPNKLTALQVSFDKRKVIKRFRELTLNENDDSPTTLDAANNVILMGCNENSDKIKTTGENLHLRKYVFENEHLKFVASIDMDHSSKFEDYTKLTYMSQDGSVAAIASSKVPTVIRIMNPNLLTETYEIETGNDVKDLHFSPDGKVLSYITSSTLEVISIVTGRFIVRKTDFDKSWALSKIKFIGEDTVLIAAALKKGTGIVLSKISLKSGTTSVLKTRLVTNKLRGVTSMDVDQTGQLAALSGNDNSIVLVRLNNLTVGKFFKQVHSFAITKVAFSPNGKILASVSAANTINVILVPDKLATSVPILERIIKLFINFILIVLVAAAVQTSYKYDLHAKVYRFGVAKWNARKDSFIMNDVFRQTTLVGDVVSIETHTNFAPTDSSSISTPIYETTIPEISTAPLHSSSWSSSVSEEAVTSSDASTFEKPVYSSASLVDKSKDNEFAGSEALVSNTDVNKASVSGAQKVPIPESEEKPTKSTEKVFSGSETQLSGSSGTSAQGGLNEIGMPQQSADTVGNPGEQPTAMAAETSGAYLETSLIAGDSKDTEASPSHELSSALSGASRKASLEQPVNNLPLASTASLMSTPIESSTFTKQGTVPGDNAKSTSIAQKPTSINTEDVSIEKLVEKSADEIPEVSTRVSMPAIAETPTKIVSTFSSHKASSLTSAPALSATGPAASAGSPKITSSNLEELNIMERDGSIAFEDPVEVSDLRSFEEPLAEDTDSEAFLTSSSTAYPATTSLVSSSTANSAPSAIVNSISSIVESKGVKDMETASLLSSEKLSSYEATKKTPYAPAEDKSAVSAISNQVVSQPESDDHETETETEASLTSIQASTTGTTSLTQSKASTEYSNSSKIPKPSSSANFAPEIAEAKVHLSTPEEPEITKKTDNTGPSSPHVSSWGIDPSSDSNAPAQSIALPDDFENRFTPDDEASVEEKRSPADNGQVEADTEAKLEKSHLSLAEVADPLPQSTAEPDVSTESRNEKNYSETVNSQPGDHTTERLPISTPGSVEETNAGSIQSGVMHDEL
ncbi:LAQU0S09e03224g1_1 [Lachancea quebecensis]|uniref:Guanine nucleotide-exchange factor SEC12 n=1 Tax=Lachancea quebecensis TaxID=1654605 RepID=A0A0P1KTD5_9SACH|nr:LAQU0S09e03224g1_1 [Lachancea quebecensis]